MIVFVNLKSKHGDNANCYLEPCTKDGVVHREHAMFAMHRNSSEPPYDELEILWFHPACFLVWCLEAVALKRTLDEDSAMLVEQLKESSWEKLIHVR